MARPNGAATCSTNVYKHPFWTRIPWFAAFATLVGLFVSKISIRSSRDFRGQIINTQLIQKVQIFLKELLLSSFQLCKYTTKILIFQIFWFCYQNLLIKSSLLICVFNERQLCKYTSFFLKIKISFVWSRKNVSWRSWGELNPAACIFENTPKGTLLPFGITALREKQDSNLQPID